MSSAYRRLFFFFFFSSRNKYRKEAKPIKLSNQVYSFPASRIIPLQKEKWASLLSY